jgi:hypothetical protein
MKNLTVFLLVLFPLLNHCTKDENVRQNITLYDKPLQTIQQCIQGKWRIVYIKSGINSNLVQTSSNCFVEFMANNKIIGNSFVNPSDTTVIKWIKGKGACLYNDSTYILTFTEKLGLVSWSYVIDRIDHDMLIYHDNTANPVFYYCMR